MDVSDINGVGSYFSFRSSDVLSDMRVNVSDEGSDKVKWYKASLIIPSSRYGRLN